MNNKNLVAPDGGVLRPCLAVASRFCGVLAAVLLTACAPSNEDLLKRASAALAKNDVDAAEIDLKTLLQSQPQNAAGRALLARVYILRGDTDAADIELDKARKSGAAGKLILLPACAVLGARGEYEKVLAECASEAAEPGDRQGLLLLRGQSLLALERTREARDLFQAGMKEFSGNPQMLVGLAHATATVEGLPAARKILDAAPEPIRNTVVYWSAIGAVAIEADDYVSAEPALQRAVDLAREARRPAEMLTPLGALVEVQLRLGQLTKAAAGSEELSKLAPNSPVVKRLRGQVAAAQGKYEEARSLLEEALAANDGDLQARMMLGAVNFRQRKFGQAEMHFAAVASQRPDYVPAKVALQEARAALAAEKSGAAAGGGAASLEASRDSMASRLLVQAGLSAATSRGAPSESGDAALIKQASSRLLAGDLAGASDTLRRGSATAREYLPAIDLLRAGDHERAFAMVSATLMKSAQGSAVEVAAANMAGAVSAYGGVLPQARQLLERAVSSAPKDVWSNLNLARVDLVERRGGDAERRFRQVLAVQPGNLQARLGAGVAMRAQGKTEEAKDWLAKAEKEYQASVEAQLALSQLYLASSEPAKALAAIERAAKLAPRDANVANVQGSVLLANRDASAALASFRRAASLAPGERGYAMNVVRAQLANKDANGALASLDNVLKSDPAYTPALVTAAAISLRSSRTDRAAGYVARLKQHLPAAPLTAVLEGDLALQQKNYTLALERYRKAAESGLNASLVQAIYQAGRLAGIASPDAVLHTWLKVNPKDAGALFMLAENQQVSGDVPAAIRSYESMLALQANNAVALNNLAFLYQDRDAARALDLARRAYSLMPSVPAIQDTYGWILVTSGKVDEGLALLKTAVRRMPEDAEVRYHYAASLARKGNTVEAKAELQKAMAGKLSPSAQADAENLLQQLSK